VTGGKSSGEGTFKDALRRVLASPDGDPDEPAGGLMALARALYRRAAGGDLAAIREIVSAAGADGEKTPETVVIIDDVKDL